MALTMPRLTENWPDGAPIAITSLPILGNEEAIGRGMPSTPTTSSNAMSDKIESSLPFKITSASLLSRRPQDLAFNFADNVVIGENNYLVFSVLDYKSVASFKAIHYPLGC